MNSNRVLIPLNSGLHLDGIEVSGQQGGFVLIPLNSGLHLDRDNAPDAIVMVGLNPFEFRASFGQMYRYQMLLIAWS